MPIYAFVCEACAHKFDELTTVSGQDKVVCPKCGDKVRRVYEGRCAFGAKSSSRGAGGGCSGGCSGCSGCSH